MEAQKDLGGFFAVSPKYDCEHVGTIYPEMASKSIFFPCEECGDARENWICIQCGTIRCSRYVNEHMVHHCQQSGHPTVMSFSDLSFWCYSCESYIVSQELRPTLILFQNQKFPEYNDQNDDN